MMLKHTMIFLLLAIGLTTGMTTVFAGFTYEQKMTLAVLGFAIYLWVAAPLPTGSSSLLILAAIMALGITDKPEDVFIGFLTPALYFILMLSLISKALVKSGMDAVLARVLIKVSRGGPGYIIAGLPVLILLLPILLPSAVARFKILSPIISKMNHYYCFREDSLFKKYCIYVIGTLNQNSTMIIFTGGGFPILAFQLFKDYGITGIGWLEWFLHIAPPLWIGMTFVAVVVWYYLKRTTKDKSWAAMKGSDSPPDIKPEPLQPLFWVVAGSFLFMIMVWITTDYNRIPLVLPPMLLVVLFTIPAFRLIDNQTIRNYEWETFLLLGSSFSLGTLLERNGTAGQIAEQLLLLLPEDGSLVIKVLFIASFVFVFRLLFVVPSSAMIVLFPIVISYASLIGLSPVNLGFLIVMIIGGVMILPIHSPTTYFAYGTGALREREHYTIGILSSVTIFIISVASALWYW